MPACAPVSEMAGTPMAWRAMATRVPLMCSPVASRRSISRGSGSSVMRAASSSRWSVVSPIAETTTTRSEPAARSRAMRRATCRMRSASARDEPPYFWTTSWDMARSYPRHPPGRSARQGQVRRIADGRLPSGESGLAPAPGATGPEPTITTGYGSGHDDQNHRALASRQASGSDAAARL